MAEDAATNPNLDKVSEMEQMIADAEVMFGKEHLEVARLLDEYAQLLRDLNIRALDVVNLEAKAKAIRKKCWQEEADKQSNESILHKLEVSKRKLGEDYESEDSKDTQDKLLSILDLQELNQDFSQEYTDCTYCQRPIRKKACFCWHCNKFIGLQNEWPFYYVLILIIAIAIVQYWVRTESYDYIVLSGVDYYLEVLVMASAACIAGGILGVVALFVLVIGIPALLKMLIFLNIPGWVVCCLVGVLVWRWSADANFKGHWETTLGRIGVALSSAAFLSQGVLSMIIGPLSLLVAGFAYMIGERRLSIVSIALAAVVLINMPTQSPVIAKHQELFKGQEEPDEENEQTYSAESRLALKKRKKILAQESGSSFDDGLSSSSGDSSLTLDTESVRKYAVANASSPGEQFDINECLVPGKYVIIDFYSEYCGPCRAFAPKLKALADAKDDVVVRKLDINRSGHKGIDWDSPLAEQYEIHSVPYLRIYSPVGLQVAEGKEAKEMVNKWIEESGDEN